MAVDTGILCLEYLNNNFLELGYFGIFNLEKFGGFD